MEALTIALREELRTLSLGEFKANQAELAQEFGCAEEILEAFYGIARAYQKQLEDSTDDGLAERLVRIHGKSLLHVPPLGRWFAWDGRRFRRDDGNLVRGKVRDAARELLDEPKTMGGSEEQNDQSKKKAKAARSMARQKAATYLAACDPRVVVQLTDLDADPWALNCLNGTLDLRTGNLRPHRREDRLTRLAPVKYDPDAQCPLWDAFLQRVQPDPLMRDFFQRAAGYTLTGVTTEEAAFINFGDGGNGKTTAMEALRTFFGPDYSCELAAHALTARKFGDDLERALAPLPGMRMATTLETSEGQRLHEQALKKLTSGEPLRTRLLYAESFEFTPIAKIWISTNHKPTITGDDDAIWRRVCLVPWEVQIAAEDQDPDLREKLRAELPGIFAWAVRGCLDWQRNGLAPPKTVVEATASYRAEEDLLTGFFEDQCVLGANRWSSTKYLRKVLEVWCKNQGVSTPSVKALTDRLGKRMFKKEKRSDGRGWVGFSVNSIEGMEE